MFTINPEQSAHAFNDFVYFTYKFAEYGHCLQGRLPLNYNKRVQKEYADFLFYRLVQAATMRTLKRCHMS